MTVDVTAGIGVGVLEGMGVGEGWLRFTGVAVCEKDCEPPPNEHAQEARQSTRKRKLNLCGNLWPILLLSAYPRTANPWPRVFVRHLVTGTM